MCIAKIFATQFLKWGDTNISMGQMKKQLLGNYIYLDSTDQLH